jgi:hypothetical protein
MVHCRSASADVTIRLSMPCRVGGGGVRDESAGSLGLDSARWWGGMSCSETFHVGRDYALGDTVRPARHSREHARSGARDAHRSRSRRGASTKERKSEVGGSVSAHPETRLLPNRLLTIFMRLVIQDAEYKSERVHERAARLSGRLACGLASGGGLARRSACEFL